MLESIQCTESIQRHTEGESEVLGLHGSPSFLDLAMITVPVRGSEEGGCSLRCSGLDSIKILCPIIKILCIQ